MILQEHRPNGTTLVFGHCRVTGEYHEVEVLTSQLQAWRDGACIQDAMPNVSAGDREFIKLGISPKGWEQMFGPEEGEEE